MPDGAARAVVRIRYRYGSTEVGCWPLADELASIIREEIDKAIDAARREVWEKMCPACVRLVGGICTGKIKPWHVPDFPTCPRLRKEGS
jgi:hypothetical protein